MGEKKNKNVIFQWTILSTFNRCQVVLYIPCFAVDLRHCHFTAVICKAELGVQVWSVHKRKTLQTLDYIYRLLFNWLEWGVQNWRSPLWHCHLTIQSNTVSSFCVQVNVCKRQRASRVTEGPFKSETEKQWTYNGLLSFVFTWNKGGILYSNWEHTDWRLGVSWLKHTSREYRSVAS